MMWGPSRQCGDNMGMMGMMWGPRRQWGQHGVETMETTAMGTTWEPSGDYGDDVGMTGQHGDHGDNMGTMGTMKSLKMP